MEILSQRGESTYRDYKPSCMNHRKGSSRTADPSGKHPFGSIGHSLDRQASWWIHEKDGIQELSERTP